MADKENKRKCFKCGRSPAEDNVKLFRFPKPAIRNLVRCEQWAKYIFPEKNYSSSSLQMKLHSEHRMLCQKHFKDNDFTDCTKQILQRTAVPCDNENVDTVLWPMDPQPGPSHRDPLYEVTNIHVARTNQSIAPTATEFLDDKTTKEKLLYDKCRKYLKTICQLQKRIKNLKAKKILGIISQEACIKKLSQKVTPTFALLLQGQLRNFKKKSTGRRWTRPEKITALRIFKRSPTCYRLLRRLFPLPSPSTLKSLLNKVPFRVGVNEPVYEVLKKISKTQKPSDNEYTLLFDEMSLKKNLNYNQKEDVIDGYQDHASQGRAPLIAGYALVFMIVGIRQRVKQPVAHYFSSGFATADRLAVLIKEVLKKCFEAGINVAAMVCDMDGVNRRALTILGASVDHPYIKLENKQIISLFDTPHLLKCFRNLFIKYNIECVTDITSNNISGRGVAKWSHVKDFYEVDNSNPNFVYAPILKKDHLNPNTKQKMKVNLAAQVLSHSVAGGMFARISLGELTAEAAVTANVISKMDKLFDALNSDCSDLRRGKPLATNIKSNSHHLTYFKEMKSFFSSLKFVGCSRKPPSQEGWIWTLNAMERLWQNLVEKHNIKSLATRRVQQDAIENLFGCIRGNCGSNTNPTCAQFLGGLKTSILSNLAHIGTIGNCENDSNIVIENFETLLSTKCAESTHNASGNIFPISDEVPRESEIDSEIQACAYVCGFLVRKMTISCETCKNILISNSEQQHHIFVQCKEYSDAKSLNYVTKPLVSCVESCASMANIFLNENAHKINVRKNMIDLMKMSCNFNFLDKCIMHKNENIETILNTISYICIKRFCVLKNRLFAEEASAAALKKKIQIIKHN